MPDVLRVSVTRRTGGALGGRPPNTKPIQPGRSPAKNSGTASSTSSPVRFQKSKRVAVPKGTNSLFPAGTRTAAFAEVKSPEGLGSPAPLEAYPVAANPDDQDIQPEDDQLFSQDFRRWTRPGYMMRMEEMEIFEEVLNGISEHLHRDVLFLLSPGRMDYLLNQLDWSVVPGSHNEMERLVSVYVSSTAIVDHSPTVCYQVLSDRGSAGDPAGKDRQATRGATLPRDHFHPPTSQPLDSFPRQSRFPS